LLSLFLLRSAYFYFLTVNTPKKNKLQTQNSYPGEDIRHVEQLYGKDWSDDTVRIYSISHRITSIV